MKLTLAENVRAFRKQRGLTQEQLAEVLGVTTGAVYKWEAGLSVPELDLIVEMADFFDSSVDALLGYRMKDNRMDAAMQRISTLCKSKDETALGEAEKALKKYPHSFKVVHNCAEVYLAFGAGDKARPRRALELLEQARLLISQNTNPEVSELTIYGEMATAYVMLGELEKGTELLKSHNANGIYSGAIGVGLAIFLDRPEEAVHFLSESLLHSISMLTDTVSGYAFVFCARGDYAAAREVISWGIRFLLGAKKEEQLCFLDKTHAELLALLAHAQAQGGMKKEARETLKEAAALARRFDANPNYGAEAIRFAEAPEELSIHDGLGATAEESIERLLHFLKNDKLFELWKEVIQYA